MAELPDLICLRLGSVTMSPVSFITITVTWTNEMSALSIPTNEKPKNIQ